MSRQVVILFGPPGAGKGTQANLLSERLGLYFFETSKILEKKFKEAKNISKKDRVIEIDNEKFDVLKEKENWKKGILCSPPFVTQLVINSIKKIASEGEDLILAGSPRTLYEVERVTPVLQELYGKENIKVVLIEVSSETTIFRNSNRKICKLMRHSILFNKETEKLTLCPLDGSKLVKRKSLDDPKTIKTRIKEYAKRTLPMVEYFEKNGIKVNKINGEQSVAEVFEEILESLK